MQKIILFQKTLSEIESLAAPLGGPKFRAKQLYEWVSRGAPSFDDMTNLSAEFRKKLAELFQPMPCVIERELTSNDKKTTKFLLRFSDNVLIETVLMHTNYGASVCVSSQAGCAMGCKFCASTLLGVTRDLTDIEMLAQTYIASFVASRNDTRLSHMVVMGSGEPLMNTKNVISFLEMAHDPDGLNIGYRHMTVSTCGIVSGMNELIAWGNPINLAISLHAPTDELRSKIMPINQKYHLNEILATADKWVNKTNRLVTYEYILLGGVNDSADDAIKLSKLLHGKLAMVNIIPWNPVDERDFKSVARNTIHEFVNILEQNNINVTVRRERGSDIDSACGQLRHQTIKKSGN